MKTPLNFLKKHKAFIQRYVDITCNGQLNVHNVLSTLILTISDICNNACNHCPRGHGYIHPENLPAFMSLDTIKLLCSQLGKDYKGRFSICGIGEPTLHPQLNELIKTLYDLCPNSLIFMITNGNELKEETVKLPMLKRIEISTYSKELKEINTERWKNYKKIIIRCQYPDNMATDFNNRAGNVYTISPEDVPDTVCYMPFYQITLDTNGDCYPCSCDWKREEPLGNIYKQNIYDIFTNNFRDIRIKLLEHRRNETTLCSRCSGGGNIAQPFKDFWKNYYAINTP